jgi:hypothetical protein
MALASRAEIGSLPPSPCAMAKASAHPATAPATVSAARGPRDGIAASPL